MAGPFRLDNEIVARAEASAILEKRSVPKQIEYWAEIGRRVEQQIDRASLLAIIQDLAVIDVKIAETPPIDVNEVFGNVDADRASGRLSNLVTKSRVVYEASTSEPGLLDRIDEDGQRTTGYFKDGRFFARPTHSN